MTRTTLNFDVLIIGSGFGGSVPAMRLAQKGYRVAILETGKRYGAADFAKTNWDLRRYLWWPFLRCFGIMRIRLMRGLMFFQGVGVGGGSLVYANTLMQPRDEVFDDPSWPMGLDWKQELQPHYVEARRMLGVTRNPHLMESEKILRQVGEKLGVGDTFHATDVGVYFADPNAAPIDPYFEGKGPARSGCTLCGGCMVGCRHNAKNTLDKNYLYFAEKHGAKIFAEHSAVEIKPVSGGYEIQTQISTSWRRKRGPVFRASKVIVSAGVMGTLELLFRNRDTYGTLAKVSPQLGQVVRTNGESVVGVTSYRRRDDLSKGIAIGAAIHPDAITKIEQFRYSAGSNALRPLAVPLTPPGTPFTRPLKMLWQIFKRWPQFVRLLRVRDWASNTIFLLVMRSSDEKMNVSWGRSILHGFRRALQGDAKLPTHLPVADRAVRELAKIMKGEAQNVVSDVVLATPFTAHLLGGCRIGTDPSSGVVDVHHQVFRYPGLYVSDGSVIPCNLGVNPSLTITAMAERFAAQFPPVSSPTER